MENCNESERQSLAGAHSTDAATVTGAAATVIEPALPMLNGSASELIPVAISPLPPEPSIVRVRLAFTETWPPLPGVKVELPIEPFAVTTISPELIVTLPASREPELESVSM